MSDTPDTPAPSLGEALAAIRSRCEAASPPPWQWNVNRVGQEVLLYSEPGGRNIVMDFVRLGMSRAQPRFRVDGVMETAVGLATEVVGQEHNAAHLKDLTHPDAAFIAHAPEDIRFLLAAIARLEAENAALREQVEFFEERAQVTAGTMAEHIQSVRDAFLEGFCCASGGGEAEALAVWPHSAADGALRETGAYEQAAALAAPKGGDRE